MKNAAAAQGQASRQPGGLARELAYALDPVRWAEEQLGFVCDPWQERMLRSTAKRVLLNCSRQSGKSTVTSILAVWTAIFMPGSLILLLSRQQRQSGELFAKCATSLRSLPSPPALETDNTQSCRFANGSRIISLPGEGDSIRGFSAPQLCLVDEAAFVSDELLNSLRPMLAVSDGRLIMMSTPHGKRGAFYRAWNDTTEVWQKEMVTAAECPRINPMWLRTEMATVGPFHYAQEYECCFIDSNSQLFSSRDIEAAITPIQALPIVLANAVTPMWAAPAAPREPAPEEPWTELPGTPRNYVVALDLGQAADFSALVVLERREEVERTPAVDLSAWEPRTPWGSSFASAREKTTLHHHVVFACRLQLGTSYPAVIEDVSSLLEQLPELPGDPALWIDATGGGRPVLDEMVDAGLEPHGLSITGGNDVTIHSRRDIRVPKHRLVAQVRIAFQTRKLRISAAIPTLPTLITELEGFTAKLSSAGGETFEAWAGLHDDLVMALAIAVHGSLNPLRAPRRFIL